jgi:hypothetical protein
MVTYTHSCYTNNALFSFLWEPDDSNKGATFILSTTHSSIIMPSVYSRLKYTDNRKLYVTVYIAL